MILSSSLLLFGRVSAWKKPFCCLEVWKLFYLKIVSCLEIVFVVVWKSGNSEPSSGNEGMGALLPHIRFQPAKLRSMSQSPSCLANYGSKEQILQLYSSALDMKEDKILWIIWLIWCKEFCLIKYIVLERRNDIPSRARALWAKQGLCKQIGRERI